MNYSFRVLEQEVVGTFTPTFGTSVFHGEITVHTLYSTDLDFLTLTTPGSNGDLPVTTLTYTLKNTAGTPLTKTRTATARLNDYREQWRAGNFVVSTARGILTAQPTDA